MHSLHVISVSVHCYMVHIHMCQYVILYLFHHMCLSNLCFFCFLVFLAEDEKLLELDLDDVLQQTDDLKEKISAVDKELAHAEKPVCLVKMRKAYAELMSTKCKYDDSTQRLSDMKRFLFDNGAYSLCFTFLLFVVLTSIVISVLSLHFLFKVYLYLLFIYFCNLFAADVLNKPVETSANIAVPFTHGTSSTKGCASG